MTFFVTFGAGRRYVRPFGEIGDRCFYVHGFGLLLFVKAVETCLTS
jgi:hypothetical protein